MICRNIKAGKEKDYDDWLRLYLTFERKAPGYLGTTIILPGGASSNLRYIIHRLTNRELMKAWENSAESQNLLEEANNYSKRHYETSAGLEILIIAVICIIQIVVDLRHHPHHRIF